jgi:hypothetical protein
MRLTLFHVFGLWLAKAHTKTGIEDKKLLFTYLDATEVA